MFNYPFLSSNLQIQLVDMKSSSQKTLLPEGHAATYLFISPDHRWLAYDDGKGEPGNDVVPDLENMLPFWQDRYLVIVSADGQERTRILYQQDWGALSRWLTDETLIIRRTREDSWYSTYTARWVLNPFTGKRFELPPDPKDIYKLYPPLDWDDLGMISYNQALTRRIYPSNQGDLVLEELPSQKILARIQTTLDSAPDWSPDGQQFVRFMPTIYNPYPSDGELFSVNLQGESKQITHLVDSKINIYPYQTIWSPDGKKIAFWVKASSQQDFNDVNLAILDLSSGNVTIYSIESSFNAPPKPYWSPESSQILVGTSSEEGEKTFLLDLNDVWAVQVADKKIPGGWLTR